VREAALLEGDFLLSSGRRSRYYVDKYLFSTEPALLGALARALAERLPGDVERLAGVELGAVPLAAAVALETGLPFVIVRKERKGHGASAGRAFEGRLERGERVVLVEDVVTTGSQALKAAGELREAGAETVKVVAVLDRREGGREPHLGGYPFEALLSMEDMVGKSRR
jgi:orotate phosphoribosyltransferase